MLLRIILYYLYGVSTTRALPFSFILPIAREVIPSASASSCQSAGGCRSIWDIIWSCLVTIFTCTWVAIHPNIPSPEDSWLKRNGRQVGVTFMALIAPEIVILWAMRQRIAARELRDLYHGRGWTLAHGFFTIMGGFMLCDEHGRPKQALLPEEGRKEGRFYSAWSHSGTTDSRPHTWASHACYGHSKPTTVVNSQVTVSQ